MRRGGQFTKPNTNGIWYYFCIVCQKKYTKQGSHSECYKRYCSICLMTFTKKEYLETHALTIHGDDFCTHCNEVYKYNTTHKRTYH